jgi:Tfp pilus assembly protein PilF
MKLSAILLRLALGSCLCWLVCAPCAFAQAPPGGNQGAPNRPSTTSSSHTIRGKVFLPSGNIPDQRMRVVLELSTGGIAGEVFTDSVGNFEFRSLPNNTYKIVVPSDHQSFETGSEQVEAFGSLSRTFLIQVYLKEKDGGIVLKPADRILTVADLQQPPKDAKKAYEKGLKSVRDNNAADAAKHLQEAISHYPEYLLALNKLGEQYLALNRLDDAQKIFERAVGVSGKYPLVRINLGIMLFNQKKYDEAIEHFEAANTIDEKYPMSHLYLGRSLMSKTPPDLERAEKELARAVESGGKQLVYARLDLFNLNLRRQSLDKAALQLESYLKEAPDSPQAPQVRDMLGKIKKMLVDGNAGAKKQ